MSAPATTTTTAAAAPESKSYDAAPMIDEDAVVVEPNQLVFGFSASLALVYAALIRHWYKDAIIKDNIKYPDANGTAVSETWALSTREIDAWDSAATQIGGLSAVASAFWFANLAVGQNGNLAHKIFYLVSSAFRVTPLLIIYHALKIQRQYLPNGAAYTQQVTLASSVPNAVLYLYNPDQTTTTSFDYLDSDAYHNHLFGLYLLGFVTLAGINGAAAGIKADWVVKNEAYQAANASEEEEGAAEEPAAEEAAAEEPAPEEPAPEEEVFF